MEKTSLVNWREWERGGKVKSAGKGLGRTGGGRGVAGRLAGDVTVKEEVTGRETHLPSPSPPHTHTPLRGRKGRVKRGN